ncbi:hypothetical protein F511_18123 [Dorcoceras hygrometricum]|uniref:Uncharacterized protein n=1 Tax=Dorcoceras hygrometricum TaxID=472368 RepID=A0A2Z7BC90_9LAMI|nr:hypothetical protein F511_18123 [Dorcoceras hygrometricum]
MSPRIKAFVLTIFLIAGITVGFGIGASSRHSLNMEEVKMKSRKLLSLDGVMDYDDPGPNPKHGKRGGNGGGAKNPQPYPP